MIQFDTFINRKLMLNKNTQKEPKEELLTIKEAAELLKVSEVSVKRYISKEVIPSVKTMYGTLFLKKCNKSITKR